jgi:hypothetical protein
MADDREPARGRRLRALEQARDDLRAELEEDGAAAPGEPVAPRT